MSRRFILTILFAVVAGSTTVSAQSMSDMRINEILVKNTDDFVDDFGHKVGWIELFNSSYGTVDIGGCYLTNDPQNLTKYLVPKGDVLTKIKPRQHTLFWADNQPFRGTFHINFTLDESKEVLLVSSDGKTIIDRISIPHEILGENVSYGRIMDGKDVLTSDKRVDISKTWGPLKRTSPKTSNYGVDIESAAVVFKKIDPYGAIMSFTAMTVVFISLILLYVMFKYIGKYNLRISRKNTELAASDGKKIITEEETSAEVYAAISTALHCYFDDEEAHDYEHTILTIDKVTRNYSPWSSKIYTLRETPIRK